MTRTIAAFLLLSSIIFCTEASARWTGYGHMESIEIYPGDGTSQRPSVVVVDFTTMSDGFAFQLTNNEERLMLQGLMEAYNQHRAIKLLFNENAQVQYWYRDDNGSWVSTQAKYTIYAVHLGRPDL
jgi:hypothetical protein